MHVVSNLQAYLNWVKDSNFELFFPGLLPRNMWFDSLFHAERCYYSGFDSTSKSEENSRNTGTDTPCFQMKGNNSRPFETNSFITRCTGSLTR
mmetsp:Transcript_19044/g.39131  ORF Transcript_19044/g.39131 Transcript_19044/m.39131 type:complete len:93 (+) Transcript_19044:595-873(+)